MLPHDLPHWQTVYGYYRSWSQDGTLAKIEPYLNLNLTAEVAHE
jgi:transposase